jgi:hypothetical protein
MDISSFTKSSSNAYYPGSFRFQDDLCAISSGSGNGIMIKVFSKSLEGAKSMLKPCPISVWLEQLYVFSFKNYFLHFMIQGKHMVENYLVNSRILPANLLPSGQHRIDSREYNKDNETIMIFKYYFTVNNPFF